MLVKNQPDNHPGPIIYPYCGVKSAVCCYWDPPNSRRHSWHHDAQFPSNQVIEQHGSQPARYGAQCVDRAEPGSLLRVHSEPGVGIRALELWQYRGWVDKGVTEAEVPQDGREDSQEQFGVADLVWKDVDQLKLHTVHSNSILWFSAALWQSVWVKGKFGIEKLLSLKK